MLLVVTSTVIEVSLRIVPTIESACTRDGLDGLSIMTWPTRTVVCSIVGAFKVKTVSIRS